MTSWSAAAPRRASYRPPAWLAQLLRLGPPPAALDPEDEAFDEDDIDWSERVSGKRLDLWQRRVLCSSSQQTLMNCSRQVGKTEIVSIRAALRAKRYRRTELVLAPTLYQSSKTRVRAERWLQADGTRFTTKNATTLELRGGGMVISLPGDRPDLSARSETVDDLIVDEASRVKEALIVAATPTTATRPDATITYLSTPAGKRGEFHRAWEEPEGWQKFSIKATQCPRIQPEFLARERQRLGPLLFSQEYECAFIADSTAVLDPDAIARIFASPAKPSGIDWTRDQVTIDWDSL